MPGCFGGRSAGAKSAQRPSERISNAPALWHIARSRQGGDLVAEKRILSHKPVDLSAEGSVLSL